MRSGWIKKINRGRKKITEDVRNRILLATDRIIPAPAFQTQKEKNVLIMIDSLRRAGAQKVACLLASALSERCNANAQTENWTGSNAQKFTIRVNTDGSLTFINKNSGKVLDVAGGKSANGTNVWQYSWNGSPAQLWKIAENNDGTLTFHLAINSSFALDLKGAKAANKQKIQIYKGNGSKAQKWVLTKR